MKGSKDTTKSNIVWGYLGTAFNFGTNLFLLPLILAFLPENELGMWYAFASASTVIQLVNFGFSPCIMRFIGRVWGGSSITESDFDDKALNIEKTNFTLLNSVIALSRKIYLFVSIIVAILALGPGTLYISTILEDLPSRYVLVNWAIYSVAISIDNLFSYWVSILRGLGCTAEGQKCNVIAKSFQIIISFIGLILGLKLWSLTVAYLVSGIVLRFVAMRYCLVKIGSENYNPPHKVEDKALQKTIFSTSMRFGAVAVSSQFVAQAFQMIIASVYGLEISAKYGLSVQLISVIITISGVFFNSVLPEINICRASGNTKIQKELLSASMVIQWALYMLGVAGLLILGPTILSLFSEGKRLLGTLDLVLLVLALVIENNRATFTTYISTSTKLPYVKAVLISSIITVVLCLILSLQFDMSLRILILVRLIVEASYNGWKWMRDVMKELNLSIQDMFRLGIQKIKELVR